MFHGQFVTRNCRMNESNMNLMVILGGLTYALYTLNKGSRSRGAVVIAGQDRGVDGESVPSHKRKTPAGGDFHRLAHSTRR